MQQKYGKQGFVAFSVSVDDPTDKEAVDAVKKILLDNKMTTTNYLLDEDSSVWQQKLKADGPPIVYVFNREGKIEKKWSENPPKGEEKKRAEEMDRLVEQLLQQK